MAKKAKPKPEWSTKQEIIWINKMIRNTKLFKGYKEGLKLRTVWDRLNERAIKAEVGL